MLIRYAQYITAIANLLSFMEDNIFASVFIVPSTLNNLNGAKKMPFLHLKFISLLQCSKIG